MRSLGCRAAIVVSMVLGSPVAQEVVWERTGVPKKSTIGGEAVVLGDVDGDGYEDLLHIAYTMREGPGGRRITEQQLWTLSGKDGRTLGVRRQYAVQRPYYRITAAGDMDGDGAPDYATTIIDTRGSTFVLVEVRSGKDHKLIWQVKGPWKEGFGTAILGNVDLDGDRRPDLVVTANRWPGGDSHPGAVYAYSNQGKLLYRVTGNARLELGVFQSPYTLGRMGDLDRDGIDDFVVGGFDKTVGLGAGVVLSGRTGKVLVKGVSPLRSDAIGHCVDGCGDMDGDGHPDFVASSSGGFQQQGIAVAFSGKTGKVIHLWKASKPGWSFGLAMRSGGRDLDRDGVPDVVVGHPQIPIRVPGGWINGQVHVFSGRDGSTIHRLVCPPSKLPLCGNADPGWYLEVMGPQPGSPFPLFVVMEPGYGYYYSKKWKTSFRRGRVRVLRGSPAGTRAFGKGCGGAGAATPRIGMRDLGARGVRIHLSGVPAGARAFLALGLSRTRWGGASLPLALDPFGLPGCRLYTSIDVIGEATAGSRGVARGYASIDLAVPLKGSGGVEVHGQWIALDPRGPVPVSLSDAMLWRH